jgi:4a-hydroxytetrahydrobiopterin dehydratase
VLRSLAVTDLLKERSKELPKGTPALSKAEVDELLAQVSGYGLSADGKRITRAYEFKNFHETMEFVNALAYVVHQEDHHPDLEVSYKTCRVTYWTHTVGGLSRNDFICAAKINALV